MIPELEEIIRMLRAGECTDDQAYQWLGAHIDQRSRDDDKRDFFAATCAIGRDSDGSLLPSSVAAVMAGKASPPYQMNDKESFEWWCKAEARMRFAKADAMMEARTI